MIWLVLILAFLLRLVNLNQSLWWDEAINVFYARSSEFIWFVTKYPIGDFHPSGWFAVLWVWGHIFGFSEIAVRLPSVILGVATVGLIYLLGKELFNKKTGLVAAVLLAIAPLHIYYSQEARMYALSAFSVTLSFYFLHRMILQKNRATFGWIVSLLLVLSSDYVAYFVIPAQLFYLILLRKLRKEAVLSLVVVGLLFLPWLIIFTAQFNEGVSMAAILPGWKQVVGSSFKDLLLLPVKVIFGRISLVSKSFYLLISVLTGAIFGITFFFGLKKRSDAVRLLICWILIPLLLVVVVSLFIPVMAYFRMLFILPAFYLILGNGITHLSKKVSVVAFFIICFVSILSLSEYYFNPKFQREDWRGAINFVSNKLNSQTLVIFENKEIPAPVKYYSSSLINFYPGLSDNLTESLKGKTEVYLFEYLVDVYDPQRSVERKLKDLNFSSVKTYDFQGVGFVRLYTNGSI